MFVTDMLTRGIQAPVNKRKRPMKPTCGRVTGGHRVTVPTFLRCIMSRAVSKCAARECILAAECPSDLLSSSASR